MSLTTDDPQALLTQIPLAGSLRPNFPPVVCANLARVSPVGAQPRDYESAAAWVPDVVVDARSRRGEEGEGGDGPRSANWVRER